MFFNHPLEVERVLAAERLVDAFEGGANRHIHEASGLVPEITSKKTVISPREEETDAVSGLAAAEGIRNRLTIRGGHARDWANDILSQKKVQEDGTGMVVVAAEKAPPSMLARPA